ncbi:MAG: hypothetical protein QXQ02_00045 [Halobacteria archaeon]
MVYYEDVEITEIPGLDRAIIFYLDDDGKPVDKSVATRGIVHRMKGDRVVGFVYVRFARRDGVNDAKKSQPI